jgi:hypothetical protein
MIRIVNGSISISDGVVQQLATTVKGIDSMALFIERFPESTLIVKKEFNPYDKVGEDTENYTVEDVLSGPRNVVDGVQGGGILGLASMMGIDKFINLDDLAVQLRNITPEQTQAAGAAIKEMMGCDADPETAEMIDTMMAGMEDELKSIDPDKPFESLNSIAQTVAHKILPKIDKNKIDLEKVMEKTMQMTDNLKDKDGNPMFAPGSNPLQMMTNLMMSAKDGSKTSKKGGMPQKDYMKECEKMMKDMGIKNVSVADLHKVPVDKLIADLGKKQKK